MKISFNEFKNSLESGEIKGAYFFYGEDSYYKDVGVTLLKDKCVTEPTLNFACFYDGVNIEDLLNSLKMYPFMSEKRITVVKEFYPNKGETEKIKEFFSGDNGDSIFVVVNEKDCESLSNLPFFTVVDCKNDPVFTAKWIKNELQKEGKKGEDQAVRLLSVYCLDDMSRIVSETNKLIAYLGEREILTVSDVETLVSADSDYKIFTLTESIAQKDFPKSLRIVKEMMGKGETPLRLISSIYNFFRRLLFVTITLGSDDDVGKKLGIKGFAVHKLRELARSFKVSSVKTAVDVLADAEYKIKSGLADQEDEFWLDLFLIMTK